MSERTPKALAVVVAAGHSLRMGAGDGVRKPLVELAGRPILEHGCAALDACPGIAHVVVVAHPADVETIAGWARNRPAFAKVGAVVAGGEERADSVRIGALHELGNGAELIAVHDAARPLVTAPAIARTLAAAAEDGAALLALPVRDTLKHSGDGARAERTVAREHLWTAQTPQAFEATRFREILERARTDGLRPTDDAALWERYVGPVTLVRGERTNLKITTPEDLELARAILSARAAEVSA